MQKYRLGFFGFICSCFKCADVPYKELSLSREHHCNSSVSRIPCLQQHQGKTRSVMSEQTSKHQRSPRASKQVSFPSTTEFCPTCYLIIITVTSHCITCITSSNKFQYANIISHIALLLLQKS